MQFTEDMKLYFHGTNGDSHLPGNGYEIRAEGDVRTAAESLAKEFVDVGSGDEDWNRWKIVVSTEPNGNGTKVAEFGFEDLGVWSPTPNLAKVYQEALSQAREYAAKWGDNYEADADGFNDRLLKEAAYDILEPGDFANDAYETPSAEPLTDEGNAKLDAVFEGLGFDDHATDGNVWGGVIDYVADRLGLIPDPDDEQAPGSVPHTAAEWLAALDAGRVDSTWAAEDQGEQYFPGYWQVDCEIGFTIDGYEVATVPCWVECGGEGGAWRVGDGDTGGDDCGRPQIVSESSIDGSWSVVHSGRNNMSCDFSIPAADEDEAEELARTLDDLAQEAYNAIWLRPSDIDDIETVTKIVWNANSPEEARELAMEAGIKGEENLLKAEGIWFRDEWKNWTDAFEELFPTYGEGNWATDPSIFLGDDFRSIVDGELSAREVSDWWQDYGKRLHDVEETIREFGLVYDDDMGGWDDFNTRVHQLEAWLNEHTVEPHLPFVTPPECQGQALEYSYSLFENRGRTFVIEREHDHGDGEIVHRLYVDGDPDGDFDPQNGAPKLGEYVGKVVVEKQTFPTPEELAAMKADRIRF